MKHRYKKISKVWPGSIAHEMGLEAGDKLISIDNRKLVDVLDYLDWIQSEHLELLIEKADGEEWILDIEKDIDEDLGMDFEVPLMDHKRSCGNKCIFCFVDQLPPEARDSLHFKDDDFRLSFLMGNYITLTNLSKKDLDRIHEKRISPLYISVHTTDPDLRNFMMGNKRAGELIEILEGFRKHSIDIHCQIVLCRDVNDGDNLDRTLKDLWAFKDIVKSIALVPVGLTGHREGLSSLKAYDRESSLEIIDRANRWQAFFKDKLASRLVFAADEFYVMADKKLPSLEEYEDFPQIENGVGLLKKFSESFYHALDKQVETLDSKRKITLITGTSAHKFLDGLLDDYRQKSNQDIQLIAIKNLFFGGKVSVAGLITASDIIEGLKGVDLGEKVLIPRVMLRQDEDIFLDDMTLVELEEILDREIMVIEVDGEDLVKSLVSL